METRSISFVDALECTRLLGECIELAEDPNAWQKHLTDGAERLIGGVSTAFKVLEPVAGPPLIHDTMLSGHDEAMHRSFDDCLREGGHKDLPAFDRLAGIVARQGELSFRYSELDGGLGVFHASHFYDRYFRELRIGDAAASFHTQATGRLICVMMLRQRTDRNFSNRQQDAMAFLSAALAQSVGTRLETRRHERPSLSPRMRSTLDALLEGDSEKQVAARLGLRTSTVHGYVRDLYRRYGVRSRGELLARFVKRRPGH
jgi:DNA-binding CsgD family transcriptional regulator